ncbi:MAG: DNA-directed RNA polymerase subunit beta [Rickettsiales bacterium]|jgi:DNA-directed RNA polymerase subunit beta|nr:DNA-directed RNA polymerase subunit beta [Rickettsiales bacterium]
MFNAYKRIRKDFGRIKAPIDLPNLIKIQEESYKQFLQLDIPSDERKDVGIQAVFKSVFPIHDFSGLSSLEFVKYEFEAPKYDAEECLKRGLTYAAPLRVVLRLIVWDIEEKTGKKSIKDVKEQEIFMGEVPLMTDKGTLVFNGTERVFVSQMQRSPGVFFSHDDGKTHSSGKLLFNAKIIPARGFWLDFEFDSKDIVYVRIDKKRKIPVTSLLSSFYNAETDALVAEAIAKGEDAEAIEKTGMSSREILKLFYSEVMFSKFKNGWKFAFDPSLITRAVKFGYDLVDADSGKVLLEAGQKLNPRAAKKLAEDGVKFLYITDEAAAEKGLYVSDDVLDPETYEVVVEAGTELTVETLKYINDAKVKELGVLYIDNQTVGAHIRNTLIVDKNKTREEALFDIYQVMRPGEPPTVASAENMFFRMFFDDNFYDLSQVGRFKMNLRLGVPFDVAPETLTILRKDDIIRTVKTLVDLRDGKGEVDDIDNLSNRRVRSVGELLENQYRIGIIRMERAIREKMSSANIDSAMPQDLVNARPVLSAIKEFLGSSQLSQFMDQNNPLSEITHKRRLSALGPGGLTRERADFEVRDVHATHYGRICPIETPEGQNIGLINSLASYAVINKHGFLETPYRKVENGKVTNDVIYLSAMEENKHVIAQGNSILDKGGRFTEELVACRKNGEFTLLPPSEITLMDVSPKQLVSVAAALIPFLENDDANRALMGSNMQRQAVPLVKSEAPFVGTGMEWRVALDSKATVVAENDGVVIQVDSTRIVVQATSKKSKSASGVDIYRLQKYVRSNQDTCINQKPIVRVGDKVKAGDILADGPCTDMGELALGRNVKVAFMPWQGYNYEDSIVISERIVRDDVFSSVHIEEFEVMSRDTKLGPEEITRDIPNASSEAMKSLDETGVIHIGAHVKAGDILVGKVTPKGESPVTPEEKLLRAIFGEKATEVRDTSLRVPPGTEGTVLDVRMFFRRGIAKDERALSIEYMEIEKLTKDRNDERHILELGFREKIKTFLDGKTAADGAIFRPTELDGLTTAKLEKLKLRDDKSQEAFGAMIRDFDELDAKLEAKFQDKVEKVKQGNDLLPGVLKVVKVFVAVKRKLQVGDKMAGRHGNKGIVSRVVPVEDMPYESDGAPVDIVLNPLGVPSRMNVGQILETHLGWAAQGLGRQIGDMLEQVRAKQLKVEDVRAKLQKIYGKDIYEEELAELSDDEVKSLAGSVSHGVPVATPVFDGAKETDIVSLLKEAGLPESGQVTLYNGETGEAFDNQVTVGYIYMLKLHHLVDEKIHARSVGPYSLITQQPLGGKAQFGGQRFGEMEVWALEAFGAAYTLQEMLTVKSDDVSGRTKVYESIVRGNYDFEYGIPESFNVLVKEIRSLGLNFEMKK